MFVATELHGSPETSHALVNIVIDLGVPGLSLREQDNDHVFRGHTDVSLPLRAMRPYLLQNERLVLLPIKLLVSWHILCPIAPIEYKDGHGGFIVGQRCEEISLEVARVLPPIRAFHEAWTVRGQVVRLNAGQRRCIVGRDFVLLCDDIANAALNYLRQHGVCRVLRAHQVNQSLYGLHGELVDFVVVRPDHGAWGAALCTVVLICRLVWGGGFDHIESNAEVKMAGKIFFDFI